MQASHISSFSKEVAALMPLILRGMVKKEGDFIHKGGLTIAQMLALHLLDEKGLLKMKEIASELNISLPAATGLIDRLHKIGMIKREYDESDRRIIRIKLTPKGKKSLDTVSDSKRRVTENIFSKLTEKERQDYLAILRKVKDVIYGAQ